MAVRYLVTGETAVCKACGAKTIVPDDARLIEYTPPPPDKRPAATADVVTPPSHCPACQHPATPIPRCVVCGYEPAAVRLYNPKYFEHLAVIFSGIVPLWMAFSNFRRLGLKDRARRLIVIGVPLYFLIFAVLIATDIDSEGWFLRLGMALLVNYPVGWFLKREQSGLFAEALSLGGGTARAWKGVVSGLGVVITVLVVAVVAATPYLERHVNHGRKLLERKEYAAAAVAFERALAQDSTDAEVLLNAAVCRAYTGELQASVAHTRRFVHQYPRDARGWAIMSLLHDDLGDSAAADSFRGIARRLDPNFFDTIRARRGR